MSDIALVTNVFLLMGVLVSFGAVLTFARYRRYRPHDGYGRRRQCHHLRAYQGGAAWRQGLVHGYQRRFLQGLFRHHRRQPHDHHYRYRALHLRQRPRAGLRHYVDYRYRHVVLLRCLHHASVDRVGGRQVGHISFSRKWSERFLNNTRVDFIASARSRTSLPVSSFSCRPFRSLCAV